MVRTAPIRWSSLSSWGFGPPFVLDDRGRRVRLVTAAAARARGLDPAMRRAVRLAAWRGMPAPAWAYLALMTTLEGFTIGDAVRGVYFFCTSKSAQPNDWAKPARMIALAVLIVVFIWMGMRRAHAGSLAVAYVRAGVCGSCGYSLAGLAAHPDRCVVCPECGAAWKTAPVNDRAAPRR